MLIALSNLQLRTMNEVGMLKENQDTTSSAALEVYAADTATGRIGADLTLTQEGGCFAGDNFYQ